MSAMTSVFRKNLSTEEGRIGIFSPYSNRQVIPHDLKKEIKNELHKELKNSFENELFEKIERLRELLFFKLKEDLYNELFSELCGKIDEVNKRKYKLTISDLKHTHLTYKPRPYGNSYSQPVSPTSSVFSDLFCKTPNDWITLEGEEV